jgi:hypothetical protein
MQLGVNCPPSLERLICVSSHFELGFRVLFQRLNVFNCWRLVIGSRESNITIIILMNHKVLNKIGETCWATSGVLILFNSNGRGSTHRLYSWFWLIYTLKVPDLLECFN